MLVFRQLFDSSSSTYTYLLGDPPSGEAVPVRAIEHTLEWEAVGVTTSDATTDAQRIKSQALQGIGAAAAGYLAARLDAGEMLVPTSIRVEIIDETVERTGQQTTLLLRAALSGTAVASAGVNELAYRELSAALPAAYTADPATLRVQMEPPNGQLPDHFQMTTRATGRATVDTHALARTLAGQPMNEAARYLSATIPLAEPPAFEMWPAWWRGAFRGRLPLRAERITVEVVP